MPHIEIDVTITLETPLSIGAGGSSGTLADKSIVRDGWGRPVIPGSQLKGRTRHMAEALASTLGLTVADYKIESANCVIQAIFGAPGHRRSKLFFYDLPLVEPVKTAEYPGKNDTSGMRQGLQRPSVSINRRRGVAEDARLLVQETTVSGITFHNPAAIVGTFAQKQELALVVAALQMTTRWGGAKSRGLGWSAVQVNVQKPADFDEQRFAAALRELEQQAKEGMAT